MQVRRYTSSICVEVHFTAAELEVLRTLEVFAPAAIALVDAELIGRLVEVTAGALEHDDPRVQDVGGDLHFELRDVLAQLQVVQPGLHELTFIPVSFERNVTHDDIREAHNHPIPGMWHSRSWETDLRIEEMADGHLLNVARRLLFGSADLRRTGHELSAGDALRRVGTFPWVFAELIRRGRE